MAQAKVIRSISDYFSLKLILKIINNQLMLSLSGVKTKRQHRLKQDCQYKTDNAGRPKALLLLEKLVPTELFGFSSRTTQTIWLTFHLFV